MAPERTTPVVTYGDLVFFFFLYSFLLFVFRIDLNSWFFQMVKRALRSRSTFFFFPSTFPSVDFESKMAELFLMQYRPMYSSVNYPKTLDDWAKCLSGLKAFRSHLIELRNKRKCYSLYLLKSRRYGWQLWGRFVCNPRARANPMKWWHSEQLNMAFTVRWR